MINKQFVALLGAGLLSTSLYAADPDVVTAPPLNLNDPSTVALQKTVAQVNTITNGLNELARDSGSFVGAPEKFQTNLGQTMLTVTNGAVTFSDVKENSYQVTMPLGAVLCEATKAKILDTHIRTATCDDTGALIYTYTK